MRRRWVVEKEFMSIDREPLQTIIIHPEEDDKLSIKKEHRPYFFKKYVVSK